MERPRPAHADGPGRPSDPSSLLLALQRSAGNRTVTRLLHGALPPVQRTTWEYKSGSWTMLSTSNNDDDRWPQPHDMDVEWDEGDQFDQETGIITSATGQETTVPQLVGEKKGSDFGSWYGTRRETTAYGHLSDPRRQGPHTVAHIGKRVMAESSTTANPNFDPTGIPGRTGIIPTPGQTRTLLGDYQYNSGTFIPKDRLKRFDKEYTSLFKRRTQGTPDERRRSTVKLMELNPLATYGHGRLVTKAEIKGKGENRRRLAGDVEKLSTGQRPKKRPKLTHTDEEEFPQGKSGFESEHFDKYLADIGTIATGDEDLSDLELTSDDEYSEEEDGDSQEFYSYQ